MSVAAQHEPHELVTEVERLLGEIEVLVDPVARATATAAVQALLELYGAGIERMVEEIAARDDDGEMAAALCADELVSHLLLLHGLHPVPLEQRVLDGLAEVRPYLESHGGNVELVAIEDAVVRLRMQGSCSGCPSSAMTLKLAIENALAKAAPEIEQVIAEEPEGQGQGPQAPQSLLQIEFAGGDASAGPELAGDWTMAGGLSELNGGGSRVKQVGGQEILFLRIAEQLYAYRPRCPACEEPLDGAQLERTELTCRGCGHSYDVLRAGRCLDAPQLHLEPFPLLVGEDGLVKIALPVAA